MNVVRLDLRVKKILTIVSVMDVYSAKHKTLNVVRLDLRVRKTLAYRLGADGSELCL